MSDLIAAHLRRWAASDFVWGVSDCSIVLADYVLEVTGKDGAAPLRGAYDSRESCVALTGMDKGLMGVVEACAGRVGLVRTIAPKRGDIGVLRLRKHEFAGLCLGDRWAVKSPDGLLYLDKPEVVAAWAV